LTRPFQYDMLDILAEDRWCEGAREVVAAGVNKVTADIQDYIERLDFWKDQMVSHPEPKEDGGQYGQGVSDILPRLEGGAMMLEVGLQKLADVMRREQELDQYCVAIKNGGVEGVERDA